MTVMFLELAHFNKASRYRAPLLLAGAALAAVGVILIGAASAHANASWFSTLPGAAALTSVGAALSYVGAALLLAAAGVLAAGMLTLARHRALTAEGRLAASAVAAEVSQEAAAPAAAEPAAARPGGRGRGILLRLGRLVPPRPSIAGWPQVLLAMLLGALAVAGTVVGWRIAAAPPAAAINPIALQVLAGALVIAAFPLLVLERIFANMDATELPEAPQINRLLRVPLTACLVLAISAVLQSVGYAWAARIDQAVAILLGVVAIELFLRGASYVFIPFAPLAQGRAVADSNLAGLLRFSLPNLQALNSAVQSQFGIDLSRSWALAFVQRSLLPLALGMAVMAWAVTGMTALGINQRAVYERFGVPVAVLGPGIHFHLPWPMGIIREVELGVIHDIPIAFAPTSGATPASQRSAGVDQQQLTAGAEELPPASADRLWDISHPSEQSYLIASESRGEQSFQIVDADLRVVYRVGLTDAAALDSAYRIEAPENLIRAASGQLLVRYFSRYTLADVLGQSRAAFANEFRVELQQHLDALSSGIEAIAVVVEAIHPPPGAASAYQYVQASEILANSQISVRRAEAIRTLKTAGQYALEDQTKAEAAAAELVDQARSESVLFEADRKAHQRAATPFLLERRFDRLSTGLAKSEFIVLDHRATGKDGPFIDLRNVEGGSQFGRRDFGLPPGAPGQPGRPPAPDDEDQLR